MHIVLFDLFSSYNATVYDILNPGCSEECLTTSLMISCKTFLQFHVCGQSAREHILLSFFGPQVLPPLPG